MTGRWSPTKWHAVENGKLSSGRRGRENRNQEQEGDGGDGQGQVSQVGKVGLRTGSCGEEPGISEHLGLPETGKLVTEC